MEKERFASSSGNSPVIRPTKSALIPFDRIDFPANTRAHHADKVGELVKSIRLLGLQNPLTVIERKGRYLLIAGRHRLEALRVIGVEPIPVQVADFGDIEARLWTISENLHRTELHPVHKAEQIAEFARLVEEKRKADQVGHPDPRYEKRGDSYAARELGVTRQEVIRSQTIAALPDVVKEKALELGASGGNQSALLRAAKAPTPEAQLATLERAAERPAEPTARPLRNLENLSGGELARWIKITTPENMSHRIRVLRMAADILEDEMRAPLARKLS
jgi:hypothetical protein